MAETPPQIEGKFHFSVDTGLVSELGDRLVARPSIALAELVKNAYDADASRVTVLMQNITQRDGCIIVEDDGLGMTFDAIENFWMRIATQNKIDQPQSLKYRRNRTGAKGIGRFAAGRVASCLSLESVAKRDDGHKEAISVNFDWKTNFAPGQNLNSIPVKYKRRVVSDSTPTGVTLLLDGLKDIWNRDELESARKDLIGLVNPFGVSPVLSEDNHVSRHRDPGFSVYFEVPEFPDLSGPLQETLLQGAWATLTGKIEPTGDIQYDIEIRSTGERRRWTLSDFQDDVQNLAGTHFVIHHFVYDRKGWQSEEYGVREAYRYARKHAGVRLYVDGFRVFSYGEPGNDWLALDEDRAKRVRRPEDAAPILLDEAASYGKYQPFLSLPGNIQLFGIVELSQGHHDGGQREIQINIARDRLVDNEAFEHLRTFVRNGIFWLTLQYARIKYQDNEEQQTADGSAIAPLLPSLDKPIGEIEQLIVDHEKLNTGEKRSIQNLLTSVRKLALEHDKRVEEKESQRISEISMLRVLASVGTLTSFLNHQLLAISSHLGAVAALFESFTENIDTRVRSQYVDNTRDLQTWQTYVKSQIKLLSLLLGKRTRNEKRSFNIRTATNEICNLLRGYIDEHDIDVSNQVPDNVVTPPMFLAELHSILINIFTNALKAVRTTNAKRIEIRGGYRDDRVYIQMFDSGRGLDIPPEKAFLPFETTSIPDSILGEGTGLGLYVVAAFVENYGGTVQFIDVPDDYWVTCIEIEFPAP